MNLRRRLTQMNADKDTEGKHTELSAAVIGVFYDVYNELGFGFLESVYENAMMIALSQKGLSVQRQVPVPVHFRKILVGDFKADLLVERKLLLELKAVRSIDVAFEKQLLNYLRATDIEVGLLLNFGDRPMVRRFVFDNARKQIRVDVRSSSAGAAP